MMQSGEGSLLFSLSPSFSSYSSGRFAEIAARVVEEFRKESDTDPDIFNWEPDSASSLHYGPEPDEFDQLPQILHGGNAETETSDEIADDEFEFAVVPREPEEVTISAEDIFYNGQIRPIYPVFNTNLLLSDSIVDKNNSGGNVDDGEHDDENLKKSKPKRVHRPSLGKLMSEERETNSCSSSETEELDGVLPGTYCVWTPKESLERCKKSNSMGSSKRWKLRDLLYRSSSDGKETFVFLSSSKRVEKFAEISKEKSSSGTGDEKSTGKVKSSRVAAAAAAAAATATGSNVSPTAAVEGEEEAKNSCKEGERKMQRIPCRQEMGDLFNNVNGMNKNSHQF
ncbi:uncharacterized protein LOC101222998 [Cucumis sativus]|uniref:Uncharacterized protein n=1 Tax=Cucumis sativus TaxID=3659 RepID=A0A0A0LU37_CUCSA|nr:uncharacterized protein LOC101222998 [Cucumis sativus]KGN64307.1 hypothetical protein Csa_013534 [Cucumis sativus]